jgi:hypothetical protein
VVRTQAFVTAAVVLLAALVAAPGCSSVNAADGASCTNALKDGDEIGVDCGGSCTTLCTGAGCTGNEECASAKCESGACAAKDGKPCGVGTPIAQCDNGQPCELDKDCKSLTCDGATCALTPDSPPGPADGKKNNGETDIDCGGPNAPKCADGKGCDGDGDCATGYCPPDTKVCAAPRYDDGVKNGTETDIDCGGTGAGMLKCAETKSCLADTDCNGACNYENKCSDIPSCKSKLGGYTCGAGEVGSGAENHESCCKTLPVPAAFTDPGNPGKKVYLDKYEITAGRVRAFIEDITAKSGGKPNVKAWVAANKPKIWDNGWNMFLPSDTEADGIVVPRDPSKATEAKPWNRNTGTDYQFNGQLYIYVHGHNCINTASSYGFPTFWLPPNVMAKNGDGTKPGLPRANAFDGNGVMYPAKDYLDVKSATCVTNAMLAAFCHWDGGQLATDEVLDFVTNNPTPGNQATCGSRCAPLASINATSDSGQTPTNYYFPYFADGTTHEGTSRIAAPGRMQGDVVRINAGDEPWMDLHGNLEESVLDVSGATFTGNFGLKYRGIGYNSSRALTNPAALTKPEYKAGYTGGRCMRFK